MGGCLLYVGERRRRPHPNLTKTHTTNQRHPKPLSPPPPPPKKTPVNQELAQQAKLPLAILCRPFASPEEGEVSGCFGFLGVGCGVQFSAFNLFLASGPTTHPQHGTHPPKNTKPTGAHPRGGLRRGGPDPLHALQGLRQLLRDVARQRLQVRDLHRRNRMHGAQAQ